MPTFSALGVPADLCARLATRDIHEAFPIQEATLPDALDGRDVVGKAATGSGKTLAFSLPLLAQLTKARAGAPKALVLVPTRELAAQVQRDMALLTDNRGQRILAIYGGTSYNIARKQLQRGVDVVVACPGRLEDLLEQGALTLSKVTCVVIDEADRMADMGFLPAVRRIVNQTSEDRQTMLYSATMGPDVNALVKEFTMDPAFHDVLGEEPPSTTDHYFWRVPRDARPEACADAIEKYGQAIVFTRTKHGADRLAKQLGQRGISAVPLHGDRTQAQRARALQALRSGEARALVATDVAARGIHVDDLPVVIHYELPQQATDYLHRSGRTGRAGADGVVISLCPDETAKQTSNLQKALGMTLGTELPELAQPRRLGTVNDAVAAQNLDENEPRKKVSRGRERTPRVAKSHDRDRPRRERADREPRFDRGEGEPRFERTEREPRFERRDDNVRAERSERRSFNDRPARGPREERRERRSFDDRPERSPRGDRRERPAFGDRTERASRPERGERRAFDRAPRGERPVRDTRPSRSPRGAAQGGEAVVTFFNDRKGYGFAEDAHGGDIFIHFSSIEANGFRSLQRGQRIRFNATSGPKGREATNVQVVH